MAHQLYLYIPENQLSSKTMEVIDCSIYDPDISITNTVFKIKIPFSESWVTPKFIIGGRNYYTSNSLGLSSNQNFSGLIDIPDGLYQINYSVCPNDEVYYNTKVLRDQITRCRVLSKLSELLGNDCIKLSNCYGEDILEKAIQELKDLLILLDTAVIDARLLKFNQANDKLDYVNQRLNNLGKIN